MPETSSTLPTVRELLTTAVASLGGTERDGQVRMADAVHDAIRTGEHLAVQAGTGTGKSLAYLVPAIRHAVERDSTVVVSTSTIALQRQLVDRDLPKLSAALAESLGREPEFAILKGRGNYLCLHRIDTGAPEEPDDGLFDPFAASRVGREVSRLHEWAGQTLTGDRDELVPGVSDRAWRQVSVSARECLGATRCPSGTDCFAEHARAEAGRADVVVTNHALLAIDALQEHQVLPEHGLVIIDEAHDLVDRVTSVATAELTSAMITTAAKRCGRLVDAEIADRLMEAADGLTMVLDDLPAGRLDTLPENLAGAVPAVRDAAHACLTALGTERKEEISEETARKLARTLLEEVHDTCVRILESFEPPLAERRDVVWSSGEPGGEGRRAPTLRVAPLSVAGMLRDRVFGARTAVLTSATLALGGSFEPLARRWGLPPAGPGAGPGDGSGDGPGNGPGDGSGGSAPRAARDSGTATEVAAPTDSDRISWNALDVGSPFDHARNGILYLAKHLPPPGRDGLGEQLLDELTSLVEAAGGRTLGLFSSMRAAKQAAEALRERVEYPILCQGDDATGLLVNSFSEDPASCLFGTLSLWQGVDVPGDSLQLVVVDRIPFPRPDDPVQSARQRAVEARGGNGFLTVSATHAALLLAQGTGRLHRTSTDRGVVAVLDSRLATARYAGFLRASLPPFWQTTDPEVVRAALRRLDEQAGTRPAGSGTEAG
ncbi:ATP-dependent DNA helicase DinG [Haloechinothrix alba]|uniref:ATP-dependent helicase DinG n=1 Tax=Haloechinothrix alba TaxID=664784 RepID=A0A238ZE76_9PSEU|nr:ATP-dependent DNA helicase [Haloechinothrix alba]SNR81241.1 ATP-dependent DNA helicase DinG [Haloechinothrix alba]